MKTLLAAQNICFGHDSNILFNDLSFSLNEGDRVALVGHNGCGKSTLLKILTGEVSPDSGLVTRMRGLKLAVVEQYLPESLLGLTLREAVLERLSAEEQLTEAYLAEMNLSQLYFDESEFDIPVRGLSGGQQNRLMLARAMMGSPDLILMDEPTNHLDLKTLVQLEEFFQYQREFSFMLISHDRNFLDKVTNKTVVVRDGKTLSFNLNFSRALEALEEQDEHAQKGYEKEQKEIDRLKKSAKRLATWGKVYDNEDLAKKAKTMEKRIARMEDDRTFVSRGSSYVLDLKCRPSRSKLALQFQEFPVFYGEELAKDRKNQLFSIEKAYFPSGEKIAILAENGFGKSTFFGLIEQSLKSENSLDEIGHAPDLDLGRYDQEQKSLHPQSTLIDEVIDQAEVSEEEAKMGLISFGFFYQDHHKLVGTLSGGEKARIIFLILSLRSPNFLILDEPTNHLDIEGKEELIRLIQESPATVLFTSHDRDFIERVGSRFFTISEGQMREEISPQSFFQSLVG